MEKDKIFFGEGGLTSTSANYIANQAKEFAQSTSEQLVNVSFLDGKIQLVGSDPTPIKHGVESLDYENRLEKWKQLIDQSVG